MTSLFGSDLGPLDRLLVLLESLSHLNTCGSPDGWYGPMTARRGSTDADRIDTDTVDPAYLVGSRSMELVGMSPNPPRIPRDS